MSRCLIFGISLFAIASGALADSTETDYYRLIPIPIPEGIVLEAGGIEAMPDGRLAASTRRGDVYLIEGALNDPPSSVRFTKFASGLHETLSIAQKDGVVYVLQRGELTRLRDTDGDGRADLYETVADGWELSGNHHEYAFASKFDRQGDIWVALCLTGSSTSAAKFRGWGLRLTPDGKTIPVVSGIRSPGGVGSKAAGD